MIKLMVVIHSLRGGGSERVLINLLKGLKRDEFYITLVLYEGAFDFPIPQDVEIEILDIPATWNFLKLARGFILKITKLSGLIRRNRPDVVFSLLSSTNVTLILAKLLSKEKCRVVISEHTHPTVNLGNEVYGRITGKFMKYLYPKADAIVAVSEGIKRDLVSHFDIAPEKVKVIYNPVDIREIELLSREEVDHPWFMEKIPVIISVGRLTRQKGYPYLIKAFSLVKRSFECRLVIIGDGEDLGKLVEMVKGMHLENHIAFLGFKKNPFKYLIRSSLFVLSSLYEGFGNVIVEAMALGLPVISTDCPSGPSEIIQDGKNGILVPVKDEGALSGAIESILTDGGLRGRLSEEARKRARAFALNGIVEEYRSIFCENPSPSV